MSQGSYHCATLSSLLCLRFKDPVGHPLSPRDSAPSSHTVPLPHHASSHPSYKVVDVAMVAPISSSSSSSYHSLFSSLPSYDQLNDHITLLTSPKASTRERFEVLKAICHFSSPSDLLASPQWEKLLQAIGKCMTVRQWESIVPGNGTAPVPITVTHPSASSKTKKKSSSSSKSSAVALKSTPSHSDAIARESVDPCAYYLLLAHGSTFLVDLFTHAEGTSQAGEIIGIVVACLKEIVQFLAGEDTPASPTDDITWLSQLPTDANEIESLFVAASSSFTAPPSPSPSPTRSFHTLFHRSLLLALARLLTHACHVLPETWIYWDGDAAAKLQCRVIELFLDGFANAPASTPASHPDNTPHSNCSLLLLTLPDPEFTWFRRWLTGIDVHATVTSRLRQSQWASLEDAWKVVRDGFGAKQHTNHPPSDPSSHPCIASVTSFESRQLTTTSAWAFLTEYLVTIGTGTSTITPSNSLPATSTSISTLANALDKLSLPSSSSSSSSSSAKHHSSSHKSSSSSSTSTVKGSHRSHSHKRKGQAVSMKSSRDDAPLSSSSSSSLSLSHTDGGDDFSSSSSSSSSSTLPPVLDRIRLVAVEFAAHALVHMLFAATTTAPTDEPSSSPSSPSLLERTHQSFISLTHTFLARISQVTLSYPSPSPLSSDSQSRQPLPLLLLAPTDVTRLLETLLIALDCLPSNSSTRTELFANLCAFWRQPSIGAFAVMSPPMSDPSASASVSYSLPSTVPSPLPSMNSSASATIAQTRLLHKSRSITDVKCGTNNSSAAVRQQQHSPSPSVKKNGRTLSSSLSSSSSSSSFSVSISKDDKRSPFAAFLAPFVLSSHAPSDYDSIMSASSASSSSSTNSRTRVHHSGITAIIGLVLSWLRQSKELKTAIVTMTIPIVEDAKVSHTDHGVGEDHVPVAPSARSINLFELVCRWLGFDRSDQTSTPTWSLKLDFSDGTDLASSSSTFHLIQTLLYDILRECLIESELFHLQSPNNSSAEDDGGVGVGGRHRRHAAYLDRFSDHVTTAIEKLPKEMTEEYVDTRMQTTTDAAADADRFGVAAPRHQCSSEVATLIDLWLLWSSRARAFDRLHVSHPSLLRHACRRFSHLVAIGSRVDPSLASGARCSVSCLPWCIGCATSEASPVSRALTSPLYYRRLHRTLSVDLLPSSHMADILLTQTSLVHTLIDHLLQRLAEEDGDWTIAFELEEEERNQQE